VSHRTPAPGASPESTALEKRLFLWMEEPLTSRVSVRARHLNRINPESCPLPSQSGMKPLSFALVAAYSVCRAKPRRYCRLRTRSPRRRYVRCKHRRENCSRANTWDAVKQARFRRQTGLFVGIQREQIGVFYEGWWREARWARASAARRRVSSAAGSSRLRRAA
jgi:hypothetical protein